MSKIFEQYVTHEELREIGILTDDNKDSALYLENDSFINVGSTSIDNLTKKGISDIGFQNLTPEQQKAVKKATLFRINDWKAAGISLTRINGSVGTGGGSYSQSNPHEPDYIRSDIIDELESAGLLHIGDRHVGGKKKTACDENWNIDGFNLKGYLDNYFVNINFFTSKNGTINLTKGYDRGIATLNLETIIPTGIYATIDMDNLTLEGENNIKKIVNTMNLMDIDMSNITPNGLKVINDHVNGNLNNEIHTNLTTSEKTIIKALNEIDSLAKTNASEVVQLHALANASIDRDLLLQDDMDNLVNSLAQISVEFTTHLPLKAGINSFPNNTLSISTDKVDPNKPKTYLDIWTSTDWTKIKKGAKVTIKLEHDDGSGKHTSEYVYESWNDGNITNNELGKDSRVEMEASVTNFIIKDVATASRSGWSIVKLTVESGGSTIDISGKADINLGNLDAAGKKIIEDIAKSIVANLEDKSVMQANGDRIKLSNLDSSTSTAIEKDLLIPTAAYVDRKSFTEGHNFSQEAQRNLKSPVATDGTYSKVSMVSRDYSSANFSIGYYNKGTLSKELTIKDSEISFKDVANTYDKKVGIEKIIDNASQSWKDITTTLNSRIWNADDGGKRIKITLTGTSDDGLFGTNLKTHKNRAFWKAPTSYYNKDPKNNWDGQETFYRWSSDADGNSLIKVVTWSGDGKNEVTLYDNTNIEKFEIYE